MPSRFSPMGYVPNRSTDLLSDAITQALGNYQSGKQRQQEQGEATAQRQRATTIEDIGLAKEGIHLLQPGQAAPVERNGADVGQSIASALNPRLGLPAVEAPAPRITAGSGYYIDNQERDANAKRSADARMAAVLAEALGKGRAEDMLNPGGREADTAYKRALTRQADAQAATAAATAGRPQAPVMGSKEWLAAEQARANIELGKSKELARFSADIAVQKPPKQPNAEWNQKAAFMYPGVQSAIPKIDALDSAGVVVPQRANIPLIGNYLIGDKEQQMLQAATVLHDAYLRLTTGATINPSELRAAAMQYVPLGGDSDAVKAQKLARRHEIEQAIAKAGGIEAIMARPPRRATVAPVVAPSDATQRGSNAPTRRLGGDTGNVDLRVPPHVQTIDEMIRAGKSDAEIKAALQRGVR